MLVLERRTSSWVERGCGFGRMNPTIIGFAMGRSLSGSCSILSGIRCGWDWGSRSNSGPGLVPGKNGRSETCPTSGCTVVASGNEHLPLVDMNACSLAVFLHGSPVFSDLGAGLRKLVPGNRCAAGWLLHHGDAVVHRANVVAEAAAYAIFFADSRIRAAGGGFHLAVRRWCVGIRRDHI